MGIVDTEDQAYGGYPPVAVNIWEYGALARPSAKVDLVIMVSGPMTAIGIDAVAEKLALSVTLKVIETGPVATVGVPVISPLPEFRVNPVGNAPDCIDQLYGCDPPIAVNVCE